MKKYAFLLLLLVVGSVVLAQLGIGGLPFEGTWRTSGGSGEAAYYQDYTFAGGDFFIDGYPPFSESGSYTVVLHDSNTVSDDYTLLMRPEKGDPGVDGPYLEKISVYPDGSLVMSDFVTGFPTTFR